MPMNFPDMNSLIEAGKIHKFREPEPNEAEDDYRFSLANYVQKIDLIESMEIRTGVGWDQFTDAQNRETLLRGIGENKKWENK